MNLRSRSVAAVLIGILTALPAVAFAQANSTAVSRPPPVTTAPSQPLTRVQPIARPVEPIDINSASLQQLMTLKDITRERGLEIMQGRYYKEKDELVSRHILPGPVYNEIKDQIYINAQRSPNQPGYQTGTVTGARPPGGAATKSNK